MLTIKKKKEEIVLKCWGKSLIARVLRMTYKNVILKRLFSLQKSCSSILMLNIVETGSMAKACPVELEGCSQN